jgi:hypothetical protein
MWFVRFPFVPGAALREAYRNACGLVHTTPHVLERHSQHGGLDREVNAPSTTRVVRAQLAIRMISIDQWPACARHRGHMKYSGCLLLLATVRLDLTMQRLHFATQLADVAMQFLLEPHFVLPDEKRRDGRRSDGENGETK